MEIIKQQNPGKTRSMTDSLEVLNTFDTISLEEMDSVKLLDRMDVKYVFRSDKLTEMLEKLCDRYRVLSISGKRASLYETHYFDTAELEMYMNHHNGRLNRHKVRFRKYVDSGISFFEIKYKTNKSRTIKHRIKLTDSIYTITGETEALLQQETGYPANLLTEALEVDYSRITLVSKNLSERLTIDIGLKYKFHQQVSTFPNLVIAEVKQERTSGSPFINLMQENHIHPLSISKYCIGIASMNPEIKINRFKSKLLHVNKLCNHNE